MYDDKFAALGSEVRLAIVQMLVKREMTASELAACFDLAQPSISRHMDVLRKADLVKTRKNGTRVIYSINAEGLWDTGMYLINMLRDKMIYDQK